MDLLLEDNIREGFEGAKKVLVKRQMIIRDSLFAKVSTPAFLEDAQCSAIAQRKGSKKWTMTIYYQPKDRSRVERAFQGLTADITMCEQIAVDFDSQIEDEQNFMHMMGLGQCNILIGA